MLLFQFIRLSQQWLRLQKSSRIIPINTVSGRGNDTFNQCVV